MAYRYCAYHGIECDYKCNCIDCPHNTEEDTKWFKYVFEIIDKRISKLKGENK